MTTRAAAPLIVAFAAALISSAAIAQGGAWRVNSQADAGPIAQIDLPSAPGKSRAVLIAFEYARRCSPIFSFVEITGRRPGIPKSRSRLENSKIGIMLNGQFRTSDAAQIVYDNGYEAGFGVSNELIRELLLTMKTLEYVTPAGERLPLPTSNLDAAFREAAGLCQSRVK